MKNVLSVHDTLQRAREEILEGFSSPVFDVWSLADLLDLIESRKDEQKAKLLRESGFFKAIEPPGYPVAIADKVIRYRLRVFFRTLRLLVDKVERNFVPHRMDVFMTTVFQWEELCQKRATTTG